MASANRILPDWWEAYLRWTENSEPKAIYRKWAGIFAISAAMQRKCMLLWEKEMFANLYIVLVGPSGARKGTAMGPAIELLRKVDVRVSPNQITKERLVQLLAEINEQVLEPITGGENDSKKTPVLFHSSLALVAPELTVLIGYQEKEFLAVLNDWFDCLTPWKRETKHSGSDEIHGICVSLFGATTPALLQTCLPATDLIEGGFSSRVVFVYAAERERAVPIPRRTKAEEALMKELEHDLSAIKAMRGSFSITEAFSDRYIKWYTTEAYQVDLKVPHLDKYIQRRQIHLLKLCMVFNASRGGDFILDRVDFDRALGLLTETEKDMPKVFGGIGKAKDADVLQRVMALCALRKEIPLRELMRIFFYDVDRDGLSKILQTLEMMKAIEVVNVPGGTEPKIRWLGNVSD